jgi:hypothetical protein
VTAENTPLARRYPIAVLIGVLFTIVAAFESGAASPQSYSNAMARHCRERGVESLASQFGVATTAEEAARALAHDVRGSRQGRAAAYQGCLRGLRGG